MRFKALVVLVGAVAAVPAFGATPGERPLKVAFVYTGTPGDGGWTYQHNLGVRHLERTLGSKVRVTRVSTLDGAPLAYGKGGDNLNPFFVAAANPDLAARGAAEMRRLLAAK